MKRLMFLILKKIGKGARELLEAKSAAGNMPDRLSMQ
jgi:hypothetical protein